MLDLGWTHPDKTAQPVWLMDDEGKSFWRCYACEEDRDLRIRKAFYHHMVMAHQLWYSNRGDSRPATDDEILRAQMVEDAGGWDRDVPMPPRYALAPGAPTTPVSKPSKVKAPPVIGQLKPPTDKTPVKAVKSVVHRVDTSKRKTALAALTIYHSRMQESTWRRIEKQLLKLKRLN